MLTFWNERYQEDEFIYGKNPNLFFAEEIKKLPLGKILLPCEGEGRNAVFAAQLGWDVQAFDFSEEGKKKAIKLAQENNVTIEYEIADALTVEYPSESFDMVALLYAHFPDGIRKYLHHKMINWVKPGGIILLEAFNPLQINNDSGGPKKLDMLYSEKMIEDDFKELSTTLLITEKTNLNEGKFHDGPADIIRYIGKKK